MTTFQSNGGGYFLSFHGWVIYNGNLESDAFLDFANMIEEAGARQNINIQKFKNNDLLPFLTRDSLHLLHNKETLPDFVVSTDKDIYLARQLEMLGIRVYNSSYTIETSDDKIKTYQLLAKNGLPIPKTIIGPKIYYNHKEINYAFLEKVGNTLTFPLIVKEAFGSFGEQVYLINSEDELLTKVQQLAGRPIIFQEFISSSFGRDIRLQVVGDQVVTAMLRSSKTDFRANITAGGSMKPYEPTKEEKQLAIQATKVVKADFAGVDLLFGSDGSPIVCEVNSNAHIRNLYKCTGVNAADSMIRHIKKTLK